MTDPNRFYREQLEIRAGELRQIKQKLNLSSLIRLLLFMLIPVFIYFFWTQWYILIALIGLTILVFVFFVFRHARLRYQKSFLEAIVKYNEEEIRVQQRDFYHLPDGIRYNNQNHHYANDIDLFGKGSFYQYINRSATMSGQDTLASLLMSNDILGISNKQLAVQELCALAIWRQEFWATASLVQTDVSIKEVVDWLSRYKSFAPKYAVVGAYVFSIISVLTIVGYVCKLLPEFALVMLLTIGLIITSRFFRKITALSGQTARVHSVFRQFAKLISTIEGQKFESNLLQEKCALVADSYNPTSKIINRFSNLLDALDQRNNIMVALVLNGFFLRDILISHKIEKWIMQYKDQVPVWFDTIAFFDAYNSLGNYAFNHPKNQYPKIVHTAYTLDSTESVHPLLHPENAIASTFRIGLEDFFIVTGANMAGKSTFLRTVALQIVMGNVGLPLTATSIKYTPIKLITSMRTTDSLADDESYFYSELKRLKFIVEAIGQEKYFIILDEILKGTNSTDKAIGSRKFIEKLVSLKGNGIVATHDLSLTKVADELDSVKNYYFDAQIINDALYFDYTLKQGVCKNMNASFLLKKMNIV